MLESIDPYAFDMSPCITIMLSPSARSLLTFRHSEPNLLRLHQGHQVVSSLVHCHSRAALRSSAPQCSRSALVRLPSSMPFALYARRTGRSIATMLVRSLVASLSNLCHSFGAQQSTLSSSWRFLSCDCLLSFCYAYYFVLLLLLFFVFLFLLLLLFDSA